MNKFVTFLVLGLIFLCRWVSLDSPLPASWTLESKVRFTATILERPEYTDSKTIITQGMWVIKLKGYAEIIPGSRVMFVGRVTPKVLGGKVVQIVMQDPTFEVVGHNRCVSSFHAECVLILLGQLRENWVNILEKTLPSPMSSLAAGILLGVKGQIPYDFYQQLVATGTLHIVAASGFNVMIVASVLMKIAQRVFRRGAAIGMGVMGIVFYVLLSGASASVVRAGIMGGLTLVAYYFGRPAEARRLLWVTAALMLLADPLMLVDVGFQLSVAATAGLLYIEPWIRKLQSSEPCRSVEKQSSELKKQVEGFLANYLYPTLAASIATLPIIWWHFGRVSWISPLVNILILPLIPLIMLLSALTLVLGQPVAWLLYPPLWWVVAVIRWFGN